MLFLFSSALADSPREKEPASLAVLVRHEPGNDELAGKLQPLLEAEAARQWPGHLVERAELEKLMAELKMAATGPGAREDAGGNGLLQLGKLSHADCLLTAKVTATGVKATMTRFPATAIVHERTYGQRLQPDSLALRIMTDAMKALRQRDRDPGQPYVSVGSFYYADPHRRFFQFSRNVGVQLRQKLGENEHIVLAERSFPSDLLSEFELARGGLTDHVARNLSAPPADVLLYGEFQPQPDQDLDSEAVVLDHTLVVLSPVGLCQKREAKFSCRSNEPETVSGQALKLIEQSTAEVRKRLAAGKRRRFSEQEFDSFKKQAFRLMTTPPLEEGVFYRQGSYRGPVQHGKPEDHRRALGMLECAMLFRGDDPQVLVCTGATLDGLARSGRYSDAAKNGLLDASLELIERAYRLESNYNTRGMYWRFCMSGSRSPAQRPPCSLEAARQIWSTRETESWHPHEIDSAFTTLFAGETDAEQQQAMFLQAAPDYEAKEDGLRNLFLMFGAFTKRVYQSDGDAETLRQARRFARRLIAERSALMRSLGHMLYLAVYSEMGEANKEAGVPAAFAEHFQDAVDLLPELHEAYGKEFTGCNYSYRLREFFQTYEKVAQQHGLDDDFAKCMEQYVDAQMRAGNHNHGGIVPVLRTLLPLMWKSRKYDRAHGLITEFLKHYTVGGSADYARMWLARERSRFARALGAAIPLGMDRLDKIEFDDGGTDWVTKLVATDNGVFGIRGYQWYRRGQVFRLALESRKANVLNRITGNVRDLACADGLVGIGSEYGGFYLLDVQSLETRHFTPQNSALPGRTVTLVCDRGKDFFIAVPDKENYYTLVYRLETSASKISHTDTKFGAHVYWQMKANPSEAEASVVVPQTWYHRTAIADGKTLEYSCSDKNAAVNEVTVTSGGEAQLLRYRGFELSYVFDFVQWQGQLIFATGNGLYASKPGSNEIRCLLSEPDLLFFSLCPLDDRMYVGTSEGLYCLEAALLTEMLKMK
jgi:hypothetical protein